MPHQYSRSELQLVVDELKAFIRDGFLADEVLSFYEDWLSDDRAMNPVTIRFNLQKIALLPVIENGLMAFLEYAEKKGIHLQLKAPTEELYCTADEAWVRLFFFRLFEKLLQKAPSEATIEIFLSEGDEKCLVEVLLPNKKQRPLPTDDYFKKHRITPVSETDSSEKIFPVFSGMMEDMKGELQYKFSREGPDYFRLKLPF
ncbi:MAG: hypothetical protein KGO92_03320 [Bacteroidota bacterium]|nr:hypothetical protein [Bacteroidota bacterium]